MTKKKRKVMFKATDSSQFDRNDILIYDEVARMPPFNRKTLVLIGARGIGRRALKEKLILSDKKRFAGVIPRNSPLTPPKHVSPLFCNSVIFIFRLWRLTDTSRPRRPGEDEGDAYYFVPRDQFEHDISRNKLVV